jgi:DNA repair photolyase
MNRWNRVQAKPHIVPAELKCNLGHNNTIFVCSGTDLFADNVLYDDIYSVLKRASEFPDNTFLFQSKNPQRIIPFLNLLSAGKYKFCTTIETNQHIPGIMRNSPPPYVRAAAMGNLYNKGFETMVTIEPIMRFDLDKMIELIRMAHPAQVNIGADTGNNKLPEPLGEKIEDLILELQKFTNVVQKKNLRRLVA